MIRGTLARQMDHDPRFTWRGEAVTRIENLSDIVFALALGMLVSSATRPTNFDQLTEHLFTIIPVAAGFALLFTVWNAHFTYFRRYGVADGVVVFLNCVLLLFVLFVAYPLRFIFDGLYGVIVGSIFDDWSFLEAAGITYEISGIIMAYFAVGYAMTYLVIALMYARALAKAEALDLTPTEQAMTRQSIFMFCVIIVISLVVAVLAVLTDLNAFAACLMILLAPAAILVRHLYKLPEVAKDGLTGEERSEAEAGDA